MTRKRCSCRVLQLCRGRGRAKIVSELGSGLCSPPKTAQEQLSTHRCRIIALSRHCGQTPRRHGALQGRGSRVAVSSTINTHGTSTATSCDEVVHNSDHLHYDHDVHHAPSQLRRRREPNGQQHKQRLDEEASKTLPSMNWPQSSTPRQSTVKTPPKPGPPSTTILLRILQRADIQQSSTERKQSALGQRHRRAIAIDRHGPATKHEDFYLGFRCGQSKFEAEFLDQQFLDQHTAGHLAYRSQSTRTETGPDGRSNGFGIVG